MTEHVEGEWKSFQFRMAQPSDHPSILAHLRDNFYRDEPLCKHSGYEDALADDFDAIVLTALSQNLSFIVADKATGKIAGIRVTTKVYKEEHSDSNSFPFPVTHPKTLVIIGVLTKLTEDAKIFERYPEIDHYAEFFLVSVDREYRGFGLATEIYDRAFKMLTAMKFPLIKCVFSSPYTQKIARKRGFKELTQMKFLDWKDENEVRHFPNAADSEFAILMVKELNI